MGPALRHPVACMNQALPTTLAERALATLAVPAILRPDTPEVALLFSFCAVRGGGESPAQVDHARFVALIDGLAYFNASNKELEVRMAANSRTFQRLGEHLQSNAWMQLWPYFRAVAPLVAPRAYFEAVGALIDDEGSDVLLLRPIFLRIVLDTARTLFEREAPTGQRYVHTGVKLALGPRAHEVASLIGRGAAPR
jgi:hypothetical protein